MGEVEKRAETRAHLLPEEERADSDDPRAQARAVLKESEERTEKPEPEQRRTPEESA
ncbi:hypothetical protein [Amycolatopsis minnesotensis]|uniref:Uncharacterized protein n=1 Tax=Amycolatopsis minnesotensis TaxID=337894 RepID=A0ABN2R3V6_9PSEU